MKKYPSTWGGVMTALYKIAHTPKQYINGVRFEIDRFEICKNGIFITFWHGNNDIVIYHQFVPNDPDASNCESYFDALRNAVIEYDEIIKKIKSQ